MWRHFLIMKKITALIKLNLILWTVSGFSRTHRIVCQQTSPSYLIFSCSICWIILPSVPSSLNIFPAHYIASAGPCILVALYNNTETMIIQNYSAILVQGAIRNLTDNIQITWDVSYSEGSVVFTHNTLVHLWWGNWYYLSGNNKYHAVEILTLGHVKEGLWKKEKDCHKDKFKYSAPENWKRNYFFPWLTDLPALVFVPWVFFKPSCCYRWMV